LEVHVLVEENSPLAAIEEIFRIAHPLLDKVMYFVALVPIGTLPKSIDVDEGDAVGSNSPNVNGRALEVPPPGAGLTTVTWYVPTVLS
jgi:hypothetical protein